MSRTWLVIDVTFLAYRALHSSGQLEYKGNKTGVLYGIMRDVKGLREHFGADYIVWCFDSTKEGGVREQLVPTYNEVRKKKKRTDEEIEDIKSLHKQINKLRKKILPDITKNIVYFDRFEADDCIAWAVNSIPRKDTAIMVTADEDMYQLIRENGKRKCKVMFYNPNKHLLLDTKAFRKMYSGLNPERWTIVKAIAGCKTDSVYGIDGIGEKTAIKYLMNSLPTHHKSFKTIVKKKDKILRQNLPLVQLPFQFLPPCVSNIKNWKKFKKRYKNWLGLKKFPEPSMESNVWKKVFQRLGINSL